MPPPEEISVRPELSRFSEPVHLKTTPPFGQGEGDAVKKTPENQAGIVEDFGRSLIHTAAQTPVNAIVQPVDKLLGTKFLPQLQFIEAPQHADFGTGNYWAQQAGGAVGMLGTFWLAGKGVKAFTRAGQAEAAIAAMSKRSAIGLTMKEAAITGFAHDLAFRPVEDGDKRNYLLARFENGLTGSAVMTTLAGTGIGLKHLGSLAALERSALVPVGGKYLGGFMSHVPEGLRKAAAPTLQNNIAGGIISGLPAGYASANLHSFFREGRAATVRENFESISTMSVIGGGFGAYHQFKGQHESGRQNFKWSRESSAEEPTVQREYKVVGSEKALNEALAKIDSGEGAMIRVREHLGKSRGIGRYLGMQEYGPEKKMFVQHREKGQELNPQARIADLIASCDLEGKLAEQAPVQGEKLYLRPGKDRISIASEKQETRPNERAPRLLGARSNPELHAENLGNLRQLTSAKGEEVDVNNIVRKQLKETGLSEKGWSSQVTEKGSLMDNVGADIVLYNERTGEVYLLDCTEQSKNPPAIRAAGVIEIRKSWFRADGKGEEMPSDFPHDVGRLLLDVTGERGGKKPILNMNDVALPNIKFEIEANQLPQLQRFVRDLDALARDPSMSQHKRTIEEYSKKLKDTTLDYLEWEVKGSTNPDVTATGVSVARESILDYFIAKKSPKVPPDGPSNIKIKHDNVNPENAEVRFRSSEGDLIRVGLMGGILNRARQDMLHLTPARARVVETEVGKIREEVAQRQAEIEAVQQKRRDAATWDEFTALKEELSTAQANQRAAAAKIKPFQPELSIINRLKKANRSLDEFNQFLMRDQGEIRNGARRSPDEPGILEVLYRANLSRRTEDVMYKKFAGHGNAEPQGKPFEAAGLTEKSAKDFVSAVYNEWGELDLQPGMKDPMVELSLSDLATNDPSLIKLRDGYERGVPEAIYLVHRLLLER